MMVGPTWTPGEHVAWHTPTDEWVVRASYRDESNRRCTAYTAMCNAGGQPNEANARLYAAASDLYHALKAARDAVELAREITGLGQPSVVIAADRALAKATGVQENAADG